MSKTKARSDAEARGGTTPDAPEGGRAMLERLDIFLDEQAEDHRRAMEEVVNWLWKSGNLEHEIHQSVAAIGSLFQKWSFEILFLLRLRGTMRFNQLKEELAAVGPDSIGKRVKDLAGVGSRTLSERLKDLEARGMIERRAFAEVPVRVEYSLTARGMRFGDLMMPVIAHLRLTSSDGT